MGLKVRIPEDFKPEKPSGLKKFEGRDIQYWIYTKDGQCKKYKNASADEVFEHAKSLFQDFSLKDSTGLGLMTAKAVIIDIVLGVSIFFNRNLFGGPEYWDSLEEWQRVSKLVKKENKRNDKE